MGNGVKLCALLPWDTDFFGLRIARVLPATVGAEETDQILDWCAQNRVDCLYFLAAPDDYLTTKLASEHAFLLVDVRMTLARSTAGLPPADRESVRNCVASDVEQLKSIARRSFGASRFYFDQRFPREMCDALYAKWVEKSCNGYADAVLVAGAPGNPGGFVSLHLKDGEGQIGLVGVKADLRGQGVGGQLVKSALGWFAEHGVATVSVVTQGRNTGAQRLYQRCGFCTRDVQLWYHRWFDSDRESAGQ